MKVFISSLITGFEPFRASVRKAVETLRHEPIMAEDFGASPRSPQVACLNELRAADLVVLILGPNYGAAQAASGISATHEEYRAARGRKPVIAFVQRGIEAEPEQKDFIAEVQGWEQGLFRGDFADPDDLSANVIRALHDYEVTKAVAPVDAEVLLRRAEKLLGPQRTGANYGGEVRISLAMASGPTQRILRPVEIEAPALSEHLHQAGLFGEARIFDGRKGVTSELHGSALVIEQQGGASFLIDEEASMLFRLPATEDKKPMQIQSGFPAIVEEVVGERIESALRFAAQTLEQIDPTQKITHVAIAARIDGGEYMPWKTRAEQNQSSRSHVVQSMSSEAYEPVLNFQPRPALRLNTSNMVEDIIVPIRRGRRSK